VIHGIEKRKEKKMKLSWKEILQKMEQINDGQRLKFIIPATFGGGMAIIERDQKSLNGEGKYIMRLGKDENASPFYEFKKPKDLAKWVADRMGDLV
jgi:hypothetical protein